MLSIQLIESVFSSDNPGSRIYVAYSGGVDSHVLLHLCACTPSLKDKITAVYVHHGLQAAAESWPEHCKNAAAALGVEFNVLRVNAGAAAGQSREEAARDARYAAFKMLLTEGDVLLVGQHREDQLETMLLQLFRGAGLAGLSGMPEQMPFGHGVLLRPFLAVDKQAINNYARQQQLSWVEDPSNQCSDYDRNFLRNQVLPLLKQRWPGIDKTVSRSARHCAEAQGLVNEIAGQYFDAVFNRADQTLIISQLTLQSLARQKLVLRQWFAEVGLKMPSENLVEHILNEVVDADGQSAPLISTQGFEIRRYRDRLYCLPKTDEAFFQAKKSLKKLVPSMVRQAHHERNQQAHHERNQQVLHERHQQIQEERNQQTDHERNRQAVACNESFDFGQESAVEGLNQGTAKSWPTGQRSISLTQHQSLSWVESSSGILAEHWHTAHIEIKFRSGGEKISLPGRSGHHTLKKLFQEAGIPPWERELMPLIYLNGQLAAIGEQWVSADFYGEKVGACISLHWQRQVTGPKDNDEVVVVD